MGVWDRSGVSASFEDDQQDHRDRPLAHQGGGARPTRKPTAAYSSIHNPALTISEIDGDRNRPE